MKKRTKPTIEDVAKSGCPCPTCSSQDILDNFEQVGKKHFTRLALAALEIAKNESKKS